MACAAVLGPCGAAVGIVATVIDKVSDLQRRVSTFQINKRQQKQLLDNVDTLQQLLEYIRDQQNEIRCIPKVLDEALAKIQRCLDSCLQICEEISQQKNILLKFVTVYTDNEAATKLNFELLNATTVLQMCLGMTSFEHSKETRKHLQRVERVARNPYAGIYAQIGTAMKAPGKVDKPVVECEGGLMHVQWTDKSNPQGSLEYYEVQFDEGAGFSTQLSPKSTGCTFDQQTLKPGHSYSIRVRGVNGRGPGEWSESTVCRFRKCPPEQPQPPSNRIDSPTSATVFVAMPELDSNEDPVTNIVVEYCDGNSTEWCKRYSTADRTRSINEVNLNTLAPDTTYQFRAKLRNRCGISPPSAATVVQTKVAVPGEPHGLRVSSKRTDEMIKIRWNEPRLNPHSVDHYEIECRRKGVWMQTNTSTKMSVKFKNLKSNTKYTFRVRAVNRESCFSEWTDEFAAETKMRGARKAAAVAAGIGVGTLTAATSLSTVSIGDPLVIDSKAKLVLYSLIPPAAGIEKGYLVAKKMMKEDLSPQSSDAED